MVPVVVTLPRRTSSDFAPTNILSMKAMYGYRCLNKVRFIIVLLPIRFRGIRLTPVSIPFIHVSDAQAEPASLNIDDVDSAPQELASPVSAPEAHQPELPMPNEQETTGLHALASVHHPYLYNLKAGD